MTKTQSPVKQRRYIRFPPEPLECAYISHQTEHSPDGFEPDSIALISNMSPLGGCCLVLRASDPIKEGDQCLVRLGELRALKAVLKWRRPLDEEFVRCGFQFLE